MTRTAAPLYLGGCKVALCLLPVPTTTLTLLITDSGFVGSPRLQSFCDDSNDIILSLQPCQSNHVIQALIQALMALKPQAPMHQPQMIS